jgi:hypothetical protein
MPFCKIRGWLSDSCLSGCTKRDFELAGVQLRQSSMNGVEDDCPVANDAASNAGYFHFSSAARLFHRSTIQYASDFSRSAFGMLPGSPRVGVHTFHQFRHYFSSARWCGHGLALLRRATIDFILALVETPKLQITNVCSIIEQKRYQRAIAGRQWRI